MESDVTEWKRVGSHLELVALEPIGVRAVEEKAGGLRRGVVDDNADIPCSGADIAPGSKESSTAGRAAGWGV